MPKHITLRRPSIPRVKILALDPSSKPKYKSRSVTVYDTTPDQVIDFVKSKLASK